MPVPAAGLAEGSDPIRVNSAGEAGLRFRPSRGGDRRRTAIRDHCCRARAIYERNSPPSTATGAEILRARIAFLCAYGDLDLAIRFLPFGAKVVVLYEWHYRSHRPGRRDRYEGRGGMGRRTCSAAGRFCGSKPIVLPPSAVGRLITFCKSVRRCLRTGHESGRDKNGRKAARQQCISILYVLAAVQWMPTLPRTEASSFAES